MQWGPWAEVGMAAGAGIHERMKAGGFGLISIEVRPTLTWDPSVAQAQIMTLTLPLTLAHALPLTPAPSLTPSLTQALTLPRWAWRRCRLRWRPPARRSSR